MFSDIFYEMTSKSTDFTKNDSPGSMTSSGDISSTTDFVMVPNDPIVAQKRPNTSTTVELGEPPTKKKPAPSICIGTGFKWNLQALASAAEAVETGGKSPVSALNELGVKVSYSVLKQRGPAHCPSFTVAVTVADMTFEGWGHSKREARASAARSCLNALLARAGRLLRHNSNNPDFTADESGQFPQSEFQCLEAKLVKPPPPPAMCPTPPPPGTETSPESTPEPSPEPDLQSTTPSMPAPPALFSLPPAPVCKSAINTLYESCPGVNFFCTYGDGTPLDVATPPLQLSHSMRFKVICTIKDRKFEGYGSSKKLAKLAAARCALGVVQEKLEPSPLTCSRLPQTLADFVAKLVNEKFNLLMKDDLIHAKRKVLAGIVITINNRPENARVIAVATGTKCVSGEHMSVRGMVVNDCHAEVVARRCLQRHLYAQLLMYANSSDPRYPIPHNDLEPVGNGGYQLKSSRNIHLYVSTAPCGDGRIFSPHDNHDVQPDKHPNRLARGQLRTKIESGEGTIPVKNCNNVVQTWDGVLQGERLVTMSCSDKVAKWCTVGLQGALLSTLIRPVYLNSIILGSLLHHHHLYRAICGRVECTVSELPPPYRLQRPMLARAASTEARTPARAPSHSVSWCATSEAPEIINATTGKLESGQPSLLCKQSMFARWQHLVSRLSLLPQDAEMGEDIPDVPSNLENLLYSDAKQFGTSYQAAKLRLIEAFDKANLGRWIKKPLEQDQFVCEIANAVPSALFA